MGFSLPLQAGKPPNTNFSHNFDQTYFVKKQNRIEELPSEIIFKVVKKEPHLNTNQKVCCGIQKQGLASDYLPKIQDNAITCLLKTTHDLRNYGGSNKPIIETTDFVIKNLTQKHFFLGSRENSISNKRQMLICPQVKMNPNFVNILDKDVHMQEKSFPIKAYNIECQGEEITDINVPILDICEKLNTKSLNINNKIDNIIHSICENTFDGHVEEFDAAQESLIKYLQNGALKNCLPISKDEILQNFHFPLMLETMPNQLSNHENTNKSIDGTKNNYVLTETSSSASNETETKQKEKLSYMESDMVVGSYEDAVEIPFCESSLKPKSALHSTSQTDILQSVGAIKSLLIQATSSYSLNPLSAEEDIKFNLVPEENSNKLNCNNQSKIDNEKKFSDHDPSIYCVKRFSPELVTKDTKGHSNLQVVIKQNSSPNQPSIKIRGKSNKLQKAITKDFHASNHRHLNEKFIHADLNSHNKKYRHEVQQRHSYARDNNDSFQGFEKNKSKAMNERRVVYVGNIPNWYTQENLMERFQNFGHIENIELKTKDCNGLDNCYNGSHSLLTEDSKTKMSYQKKKIFGFITFKHHADATRAIEYGNNSSTGPVFTLNFGGRRSFVGENYSDLDAKVVERESFRYNPYSGYKQMDAKEDDYALLLKREQRKRGLISYNKLS